MVRAAPRTRGSAPRRGWEILGAPGTVVKPVRVVSGTELATRQSTRRIRTSASPHSHDLVNARKVLLVDDHADNCDVYALILEYVGYEVQKANDGWEGVQRARSWKPDVILMDISMPVLDGLQATEILKLDADTRRIPVIAISAHDDPRMIARSLAAGAEGYLVKPTAPARVLQEIERCLERTPGPQAGSASERPKWEVSG
jgi:two-component system, cell cycle response regulator DivK